MVGEVWSSHSPVTQQCSCVLGNQWGDARVGNCYAAGCVFSLCEGLERVVGVRPPRQPARAWRTLDGDRTEGRGADSSDIAGGM
jgi:hypothetical protein